MELTTFEDEHISGIVSFWNDTFSDRRNFQQMTPALFQERVLDVQTSMESFDPEQFFVALDGAEVIGVMHVGTHPEPICRLMYGDEWDGGELGYVGLLAVRPDRRGEGIGTELWKAGAEKLAHTSMITLDGQCLNPYYGNSLGPFPPLWGTTEGISVRPSQERTVEFFERRGFEPTYNGVSLEVDLVDRSFEEVSSRGRVRLLDGEYPPIGEDSDERLPYPEARGYFVVQLVIDELTAGLISLYPFHELDEEKWGVYEFQLAEEYTGGGSEEALLSRALEEVVDRGGQCCETFVLEELSEGMMKTYQEFGFEDVARWLVY